MTGRLACASLALMLVTMASGCNDTGTPTSGGPSPGPAASGPALKFVGFDANPGLISALQDGKVQGLVLQNPYNMGDLGVRAMVVHLEKGEVKNSIPTGEKLATPENLSDPAVAQLLHPPKETKGPDTGAPGAKAKKWRILVIPKATGNEFWQTVRAGALKAAEESGEVEVIWRGPEKEDDYSKQIELVEGAKALGVDGIVLAPLDSKALVSPVERAIDGGIPVIIIDSSLESKKPVSFIATDNYHGGVLAAKRMAELLGGKGNVVLLRHMVGSGSTEEREKGFLDTIARYPEVKVLSQDQYAGATAESAQQTAQTLISKYKDQVNGVFSSNEQATAGMLKALEGAGLLKGRSWSALSAPCAW